MPIQKTRTLRTSLSKEFIHMSQLVLAAVAALALLPVAARAADDAKPNPPKTWVDKDTGHRVWRLSDEPNSGGFYFNINAYTPDRKQMIYTAPDGIHVMDMATLKTQLLVPNPPRPANAPRVLADSSAWRPCAGRGIQDQQRLLHQDRSSHQCHRGLQGRHQHRRRSASSSILPAQPHDRQHQRRRNPRRRHLHRGMQPARSTARTCRRARNPPRRRRRTTAWPAPHRARTTSRSTRAR